MGGSSPARRGGIPPPHGQVGGFLTMFIKPEREQCHQRGRSTRESSGLKNHDNCLGNLWPFGQRLLLRSGTAPARLLLRGGVTPGILTRPSPAEPGPGPVSGPPFAGPSARLSYNAPFLKKMSPLSMQVYAARFEPPTTNIQLTGSLNLWYNRSHGSAANTPVAIVI